MATWIFILHMIFPLSGAAQPAEPTSASDGEATGAVRYRGLEQMFAKFEAEAA